MGINGNASLRDQFDNAKAYLIGKKIVFKLYVYLYDSARIGVANEGLSAFKRLLSSALELCKRSVCKMPQ